jgi:hypothetical protein
MQRERRRDPYHWSWEIPVAIVLIVVAVILTGIQLGRSAANLVGGAGWTWPTTSTGTGTVVSSPIGTAFWTSLPGILGGNSGAGLARSTPSGLADRGLLWGSITLTELSLLALTAWAGTYLYLRWGPGRMRGMATVSEAEKLLGVTRLRRVAPVVRPDLYGKHAHAAPPGHRRAGSGGVEPAGSRVGSGLSSPWLRTDQSKEEHR